MIKWDELVKKQLKPHFVPNLKVDDAINICADNVYRMSADERKRYLDEINNYLTISEASLNQKIFEYQKYLNIQNNSNDTKEKFEELMNKKVIIKKN